MLAHRTRSVGRIRSYFPSKTAQFHALAPGVRGSAIAQVAARMGYSSASDLTPDLRVEKSRVDATITLSNGASVRGSFFISGTSRTHSGPEGVKDVLNGETGFFPFAAGRRDRATTILYNRDHVVMVELQDKDEPRRNPGYDVAVVRNVTMLMSNGTRLHGAVHVFRRQGNDRLSDFARAQDAFQYLEAEHATYIINVRHLVELAEEPSVS